MKPRPLFNPKLLFAGWVFAMGFFILMHLDPDIPFSVQLMARAQDPVSMGFLAFLLLVGWEFAHFVPTTANPDGKDGATNQPPATDSRTGDGQR